MSEFFNGLLKMSDGCRDPEQMGRFIAELAAFSSEMQRGRLGKARQQLELDEMYYEQKGSEQGLARVRACMAMLDARIAELG